MSVRVFAPAKINLTLKVGRPRADGYHPLQSVVAFADVGDWIEAEEQPESPIHIRGPFGEALAREIDFETDPMGRAFRALQRDRCAAIDLEKNLPIASGIGGGSSDAAATLKALNLVWRVGLTESELMKIGAGIGADIPVCVGARSSWMSGVGDIIEDIDLPVLDAVLVNPLKPLSTARVFAEFDRLQLGGNFVEEAAPVWPTRERVVAGAAAMGNDLMAPARALLPEIDEILELLQRDARVDYAALSGSGATCFALTRDSAAARAIAADLSRRRRDWWVRATTLGA